VLEQANPPRIEKNKKIVRHAWKTALFEETVEEYFSKRRAKRGPNENPTLETFDANVLGLNVAGDDLVRAVINGNVRKDRKDRPKLDIHALSRLPTKKKKLN